MEAFSELTKDHPDAKLVIVAPRTASYYNKSTQHQIQQLNNYIGNSFLHDHIIWIDPVSDEEIKLWMSISHFGVVPSMSE